MYVLTVFKFISLYSNLFNGKVDKFSHRQTQNYVKRWGSLKHNLIVLEQVHEHYDFMRKNQTLMKESKWNSVQW